MDWIIKGMGVGLAFGLFIGPMFFIYLQSCVKRGFKFGLYVAMGAWLSDLLLVIGINLIVLILIPTVKLEKYAFVLYCLGGILLIIVGLQMYYVKKGIDESYDGLNVRSSSSRLPLILFGKGVLVNVFNPAVLFYWFGLSVNLTLNKKADNYDITLFFSGAIFIRVAIDLLKLYLSKNIRNFLTLKKIMFIQRATGIVLVIIGIALITTGWSYAQDLFLKK